MRELRRMVTQVRSDIEQIELRAESDVKREPGKLYLPLLQCADCHTTGWLSRLPSGQSRLSTDLDEIYNTWFSGQPEALRLYSSAGLSRPLCDGIAQRVCTQCGHLQSGPGECVACGHGDLVDVFRVTANRTTTTSSWYFQYLARPDLSGLRQQIPADPAGCAKCNAGRSNDRAGLGQPVQ